MPQNAAQRRASVGTALCVWQGAGHSVPWSFEMSTARRPVDESLRDMTRWSGAPTRSTRTSCSRRQWRGCRGRRAGAGG
eukprot:4830967-Prymnesium_polylepis.1